MAGIYVHIPFCRRKCNYCNFYSTPAAFDAEGFTDLLLQEAALRSRFFNGQTLSTLYLGGGTPGLFPPAQIGRLINGLLNAFDFVAHPEISIELNPDDITPDWVDELRKTPVNRLSVGVQSFSAAALSYLERLHSPSQSETALLILLQAGYHNISADLIYGIPGSSPEILLFDIAKLSALSIPHISAYHLTVEPSTRLEMQIRKKQRKSVSGDTGADAFIFLISELEKRGYLHYETSNFCLPGYFSQHNTSYWKGESYLGLGPSAHSFRAGERSWNHAGIRGYTEGVQSANLAVESEKLSSDDEYNEYVMTRLRTMWGCDTDEIQGFFGEDYLKHCLKQSEPWLQNGRMRREEGVLKLTPDGKLFADAIAASLFKV